MAKKPDLTVVKDFLFRYGERVGLFTCIAVALLLLFMGFSNAFGPGSPTGDAWDNTLKKPTTTINAQLNRQPDEDAIKKHRDGFVIKPNEWDPLNSYLTPGAYVNMGEKIQIGRNNPIILSVLRGVEYFQMDYFYRGYLGYGVRKTGVLAPGEAAAAGAGAGAGAGGNMPKGSQGPGPGGVGMSGPAGGGGAEAGLVQMLKPQHMLVVTGIFPMRRQIDEYVKALRVVDANELVAKHELPIVTGINVFRQEFGPDGKATTKEPAPFLYYDYDGRKKTGKLYVDPTLNTELAEAIIDHDFPHRYKPLIHEGLVTPMPKLPTGVEYPKVTIKGEFWRNDVDVASDTTDDPKTPKSPGPGIPGPGMPGTKGAGSGKAPPIGGGSGQKSPQGPMGPMGGGDEEAPADVAPKTVTWKELEKTADKDLFNRLRNHTINIFHPLGQFPETEASNVERFGFAELEGGGTGTPGSPMPPSGSSPKPGGSSSPKPGGFGPTPPMGGGGASAAAGGPAGLHDSIVRFVDIDVKPGYRYQYYIQVRFKNPNYGKNSEVAQRTFAEQKELVSAGEWTPTPIYPIPETYHLFAVDQWRHDRMGETDEKAFKRKAASKDYKDDGDHAVMQIHRYFGLTEATLKEPSSYRIGDWAIAERVRVKKGQPIGDSEMRVKMPTWSDGRGAFELRQMATTAGKGKQKVVHGVYLDYVPRVTAPDGKTKLTLPSLLVNFVGGKRVARELGGGGAVEDAALDVLILAPDGKLSVRNSRADIDAAIEPGTKNETNRQQRVLDWRKRNQETLSGGAAPAGGGMPGGAPPIR